MPGELVEGGHSRGCQAGTETASSAKRASEPRQTTAAVSTAPAAQVPVPEQGHNSVIAVQTITSAAADLVQLVSAPTEVTSLVRTCWDHPVPHPCDHHAPCPKDHCPGVSALLCLARFASAYHLSLFRGCGRAGALRSPGSTSVAHTLPVAAT
jgi:hypothetical protein